MSYFDTEYKGKKVIVLTNEDPLVIYAEIVGVREMNKNISMVIYRNETGEFCCASSMVFPDTPHMRMMIDEAHSIYPNTKDCFQFLTRFMNFGKDLIYVAKSCEK